MVPEHFILRSIIAAEVKQKRHSPLLCVFSAKAVTVPPQAVSTGFLNHLRLATNHWKAEVVLKLRARHQNWSQLNTTHLPTHT